MTISTNRFIVYFYLVIATVLLFLFNNLYCFCTINFLLIALLCARLKLDIKNPLLLFLAIFILYQISYPILNAMDIKVFEYCTLNDNYYIYSWIATVSFFLFYGSIENVTYKKENITINVNKPLLKVIYIVLCAISIAASFSIIQNGYQSKYELAHVSSILIKLGNITYTALIAFPLYFVLSKNMSKRGKLFILIFNFMLVLLGMFTYGERNYVFNYVIVLIIYYFTMNQVKLKKIIFIAVFSVLLLASSSSMKMLFSSSSYKSNSQDSNIIVGFLNSDFASAGFNFNFLLNQKADSIFKGKTYIYDFLSPLEDFLPISQYSSTKWYTNTYWNARKTGVGFTMLGEGYINFGLFGIILQMFLLARLIKFFYSRSNKNYYYYIIYIGFISLVMYSCRQALGNIISPLFKYNILIALGVYIVNHMIKKKSGDVI